MTSNPIHRVRNFQPRLFPGSMNRDPVQGLARTAGIVRNYRDPD
jgi:hypothetical protein